MNLREQLRNNLAQEPVISLEEAVQANSALLKAQSVAVGPLPLVMTMWEAICSMDAGASPGLQNENSGNYEFLAYRPQLTMCLGGIQGSQTESSQFGNQLVHCNMGFASGVNDLHNTTWRRANAPHWMEEIEVLDCRDALLFSIWVTDGPDDSWRLLGEAVLSTTNYHPHGFNGELPLESAGKHTGVYLRLKLKMDGQDYPDESDGCDLGEPAIPHAISRYWEHMPVFMI